MNANLTHQEIKEKLQDTPYEWGIVSGTRVSKELVDTVGAVESIVLINALYPGNCRFDNNTADYVSRVTGIPKPLINSAVSRLAKWGYLKAEIKTKNGTPQIAFVLKSRAYDELSDALVNEIDNEDYENIETVDDDFNKIAMSGLRKENVYSR